MKIIILTVMTLDGKIARNEHHFSDWSSKEDKRIFSATTRKVGVMIVGRNTFDTLPSLLPGRLHIVLTTHTEGKTTSRVNWSTPANRRKRSWPASKRAVTRRLWWRRRAGKRPLSQSRHGGRIWLTVEPLIFGSGIDLVRGFDFDLRARLISVEKLNENGTVHLRYSLR